MDDEDGRCLLDVICDPEALNDFLHGSETHGHIPEVQPVIQLSVSEPVGLPRVSVDLDFLEDDDILGGSPGDDGGSNGMGSNHEPCDILQQSLAEANITEQSLQEAEAELDLGSFGIPGLTQVVQTLPDGGLSGAGATAVGVGIGAPPNAAADMLGSVLAHQGLHLQPQVMNKAISVQPFMQPVGLGNVTLQPISSLQGLPNGSQSGHLGIGQIQVVGQPTVMTINQAGQPILAKAMGSYQLHQSGPEVSGAGPQAGLGGSVLSSGGGLLIQGGKAALGSSALNGPAVCVSNTSSSNSGTMTAPAALMGYAGAGMETQTQGQIMQNVIIQRTPTPIQPKPPQGGAFQPKGFKQQPQAAPHTMQSDANKALGLQQIPVSTAQNVTFLTGKPGSNMVLSTQGASQGQQFQQVFKQQPGQPSGKPLSVHLLNQQGSIVIPSQTMLQGQNHQLLQLQAGGQIFTQHPGGHIITSQGPGGHLITNQILSANQNINLSQVFSGPIQLQSGQMAQPTLFQMPVSLAQGAGHTQSHPVTAHGQTVIQGMPIQNSLTMLGQVEGLSPAVSLQPALQPPAGGVPGGSGGLALAGDCITEQVGHPQQQQQPVPQQSSVLTMQSAVSIPCSSPSMSMTTATVPTVGLAAAQHSPGHVLYTNQGSSMILSQESLQMLLQQIPSSGHQQPLKIQSLSPSPVLTTHMPAAPRADSPQPSPSPLALCQHIHSPHHQQQQQSRPPSQPQPQSQTPSRSCTPSSHQPLFIVHNQIPGSPLPQQQQQQQQQQQLQLHQLQPQQPQPQQTHIQIQLQAPPRPPSQPSPFQQERPPLSHSPKAPAAPPTIQHQFVSSVMSGPTPMVLTAPLNAEQQHHLQLVAAQIQTLSTISQPSPQQKQLLDKLHQVQQNILIQAKQSAALQPAPQPQPLAPAHFISQQDPSVETVMSSSSAPVGPPAPLGGPVLQQKSVLVKTPVVTAPDDMQVFSGTQGPVGAGLTPPMASAGLTPQPAQVQTAPGVISAMGGAGVTLGGVKLQVLAQMPTLQSPTPVHTQISTVKMPFSAEPSKEARMLEQLRKQQGSVLHPNYSVPFNSFDDTLQRLLPYHLYQGTANSTQDYQRVDDEFESVSCQLLKRTQAMLDKYRHLLFAESKRMGPSAEMVMIDRMFIQEEKFTLGQDRVLAKERPEEFVANARMLESAAATSRLHPSPAGPSPASGLVVSETTPSAPPPVAPPPSAHPPVVPNAVPTPAPTVPPAPVPVPAPAPPPTQAPFPSTKLVIKQGGGSASVSWASSAPPPPPPPPAPLTAAAATPVATRPVASPANQSSSFGRAQPSSSFKSRSTEDEDALPQRTSKPPIKTYEARSRIGLKLKIKQDQTGFRKVVHNTALDPVHMPPQQRPQPQPQPRTLPPPQPQPQPHPKSGTPPPKPRPEPSTPPTVIRTQSQACPAPSAPSVATVTTAQSNPPLRGSAPSSTATPPPPPPSSSSSSSSHTRSPCPPSSSTSTSTSSTTQMNGTLEHHEVGGVKRNPTATAPQATTCRLPLRKTYRENVSPRVRPGVPGGGDDSLPYPRPELSPPPLRPELSPLPRPPAPAPAPAPPPPPPPPVAERTVIASVKVEKRSREEGKQEKRSRDEVKRTREEAPPGRLEQVEEAFNRGIKTTQQQQHHPHLHPHLPQLPVRGEEQQQQQQEEEEEAAAAKAKEVGVALDHQSSISHYKRTSGKSQSQRPGAVYRMDQHAPGPPSPETSPTRDPSSLPAKRCKSDSPDMDNASFSSGSPPDDTLTEHLQCAIDSILNLQQGPSSRHLKAGGGRPRQHPSQLPVAPSHRAPTQPPSSSSSSSSASTPALVAPRPPIPIPGRGHNGSLVPQNHSR